MRFLFPVPDYAPLVTAAIWLASGSVIAAAVWAVAIVYCAHVRYRPESNKPLNKKDTCIK